MDCEKVRDRFSSLLENTLDPLEEKIVKEHLASCSDCQKNYQQFDKTMQWLHSVGEEEVPDGFLGEIHKRMEERKRRGPFFSFPLKPSLQAMAMVAIVFFVLYLTKIIPVPPPLPVQETRQRASSPLAEKKTDPMGAPKEMEKDRWTVETPHETTGRKGVEQDRVPAPREEKVSGADAPYVGEKAGGAEIPPAKTQTLSDQTSDFQNAERSKGLRPEPRGIEKRLAGKEGISATSKISEEMTLRFSDREKVLAQLHELVIQFGGKIVTTEGDVVLASLPGGSFTEFKKELGRLEPAQAMGAGVVKKEAMGGLKAAYEPERKTVEEEVRRPAAAVPKREEHLVVRILLLQE